MHVDTGEFRALSERVDQLAARVEHLEACEQARDLFTDVMRRAMFSPYIPLEPQPRHLRVVDGGQP